MTDLAPMFKDAEFEAAMLEAEQEMKYMEEYYASMDVGKRFVILVNARKMASALVAGKKMPLEKNVRDPVSSVVGIMMTDLHKDKS
jgi:hypothetical protein